MAKFSVGDIVRLNSGSPSLTVTGYDGDVRVRVVWIERTEPIFMTVHEDCFGLVLSKQKLDEKRAEATEKVAE